MPGRVLPCECSNKLRKQLRVRDLSTNKSNRNVWNHEPHSGFLPEKTAGGGESWLQITSPDRQQRSLPRAWLWHLGRNRLLKVKDNINKSTKCVKPNIKTPPCPGGGGGRWLSRMIHSWNLKPSGREGRKQRWAATVVSVKVSPSESLTPDPRREMMRNTLP